MYGRYLQVRKFFKYRILPCKLLVRYRRYVISDWLPYSPISEWSNLGLSSILECTDSGLSVHLWVSLIITIEIHPRNAKRWFIIAEIYSSFIVAYNQLTYFLYIIPYNERLQIGCQNERRCMFTRITQILTCTYTHIFHFFASIRPYFTVFANYSTGIYIKFKEKGRSLLNF
jgi:hypothetical protein